MILSNKFLISISIVLMLFTTFMFTFMFKNIESDPPTGLLAFVMGLASLSAGLTLFKTWYLVKLAMEDDELSVGGSNNSSH